MSIVEAIKGFFISERETYRATKGGTKYVIYEKGGKKFLKVNRIVYSELSEESLYTHSYHDYFAPLPLLYARPRILVLGLGAGTIPFQLSKLYKNKVFIDAVDLNKECVALTKRFLPPNSVNFRMIIDDGEHFVKNSGAGRYDIIVQDIFVSDRIPPQFLKGEFIHAAHKALKRDGILAINFAPDVVYLPSYLIRLHKHFKYVYRIKHIIFGNYIIICSNRFDKKHILDTIESKMEINKDNLNLLKAYRAMRDDLFFIKTE